MSPLLGLAAAATLLLAGCAAGPVHRAVAEPTPSPPAWRNQPKNVHEAARGWWRGFGDEGLASLVERAIETNPDLAVAASRLAGARALAKAAAAERLPSIGVDASTARQRTPKLRAAGSPESDAPAGAMPLAASALQGGLRATYDVDIAGRLSRAQSSALEEAQAAGWDLVRPASRSSMRW